VPAEKVVATPFAITNVGLQITVPVLDMADGILAIFDGCMTKEGSSSYPAIPLRRLGWWGNVYERKSGCVAPTAVAAQSSRHLGTRSIYIIWRGPGGKVPRGLELRPWQEEWKCDETCCLFTFSPEMFVHSFSLLQPSEESSVELAPGYIGVCLDPNRDWSLEKREAHAGVIRLNRTDDDNCRILLVVAIRWAYEHHVDWIAELGRPGYHGEDGYDSETLAGVVRYLIFESYGSRLRHRPETQHCHSISFENPNHDSSGRTFTSHLNIMDGEPGSHSMCRMQPAMRLLEGYNTTPPPADQTTPERGVPWPLKCQQPQQTGYGGQTSTHLKPRLGSKLT
jgi:hypothetical protein